MKLAQFQNQFAKALHYQADGYECNIVSDHFSADEKLQIYRNNFIISLSEVLECTYPITYALVGGECFSAVARQHILTTPLTEGSVITYGAGFDVTIASIPSVHSSVPYLSEVARFEYLLDLSMRERFSAAPSSIQHSQPPGFYLFESPYAVFSIRKAVLENNFEGVDVNQSERGFLFTAEDGTQIVRQELRGLYYD